MPLISGLFLVLAIAAVIAARNARQQRLRAESLALAVQAEQIVARDRAAALGLAIRGWQTAHTPECGLTVADASSQLLLKLKGHTGLVMHSAFP
jgi:hypothetical protein